MAAYVHKLTAAMITSSINVCSKVIHSCECNYMFLFDCARVVLSALFLHLFMSKVMAIPKVNDGIVMIRPECVLSKTDRRRLKKRVADEDEGRQEDQHGGQDSKRVKFNENDTNKAKHNQSDKIIYPWMLESRKKNKGTCRIGTNLI